MNANNVLPKTANNVIIQDNVNNVLMQICFHLYVFKINKGTLLMQIKILLLLSQKNALQNVIHAKTEKKIVIHVKLAHSEIYNLLVNVLKDIMIMKENTPIAKNAL